MLDPGAGAVIEDVDVVAPEGTVPGTSLIAVLANGATAQLARGAFTAGNGVAGGGRRARQCHGPRWIGGQRGSGCVPDSVQQSGRCRRGTDMPDWRPVGRWRGRQWRLADRRARSQLPAPMELRRARRTPPTGVGGAGEKASPSVPCVGGTDGAAGADGSRRYRRQHDDVGCAVHERLHRHVRKGRG